MAIPDFQTIMLALLKVFGDKKELSLREVIEHVSEQFNRSDGDEETIAKRTTSNDNRLVGPERISKKALLLEYTRRGHFRITDRGLDVLSQNPSIVGSMHVARVESDDVIEWKP